MFNPVQALRHLIDEIRDPAGKALWAMELSEQDAAELMLLTDSGWRKKELPKAGMFAVEFEHTITVMPPVEFHNHFRLTDRPQPGVAGEYGWREVETINPI